MSEMLIDTEMDRNPEDGFAAFDLDGFLCPDCDDYHTNPGAGHCVEINATVWWHYCSWCLNGFECTQAEFDAHVAGHFACLN